MQKFSLTQITNKYADQPALISGQQCLNFKDINNLIQNIAYNIKQLNLPPQSFIGVLMSSQIHLPLIILGIIFSNNVAIILNTKLPKNALDEQIDSLDMQFLVIDENDAFTNLPFCKLIDKNYLIKNNFKDVFNKTCFILNKNPAVLIFTSGGTGKSKAVLHSFENFQMSAMGSNKVMPFSFNDRWLVTLPFYHVSGLSLIWRFLWGGGTLVFPDASVSLAFNIKEQGITHISLVPSQLYDLLEDVKNIAILQAIKVILVGGGAVPILLWQKVKDLGLPVFITYGLSEMASSVTIANLKLKQNKVYNSGKLLPHREIKISKSQEILLKGSALFLGYLSSKGINLPLDKFGWFHTGDIGYFDDFENLHIIGRKDNLFISGGENIYPEEIEAELLRMVDVEQAVVVPINHDKYGACPVAFIKTQADFKLVISNISQILISRLPKYKIPLKYFVWPEKYLQENLKLNRDYFWKLVEK